MKRTFAFSTLAILLLFIIFIGRNTFGNLLLGKVCLHGEIVGAEFTMEDGQKFTAFRRLTVDYRDKIEESPALFKVKFKFKNLSISANKRLSIIPVIFLMGMKGFQEKIWSINESTHEFQGIYQWSNTETAEQYPETFIFKLMTKRAAKGTVSYEIIPNIEISEYVSPLRKNQLSMPLD